MTAGNDANGSMSADREPMEKSDIAGTGDLGEAAATSVKGGEGEAPCSHRGGGTERRNLAEPNKLIITVTMVTREWWESQTNERVRMNENKSP